MTNQSNNATPAPATRDSAFGSARTQIEELLAQMAKTTNPEELASMADQLKALASQPADIQRTFDRSELPDWAVGDEEQGVIDAFFNGPAERGAAESAFAIPRGQSSTGGTGVMQPVAEPTPEPEPTLEVNLEPEPALEPELTLEAAPELTPEAAPTPAVALTPESEPNLELEPIPSSEPTLEPEPADAVDAVDADAAPEEADAEESHHSGFGGFNFGKDKKVDSEPPRREDFARFHCIYESRDGQLALYEDENGHLSAVNTNRFI